MAQEQKHSEKVENAPEETEAKDLTNPELAEDVDDLLNEIDDVLEENAEQFVMGYIQQGGE